MGQPVRHQHYTREDPDTAENIAEIFLYMCKGIKHNVGQLSVVFMRCSDTPSAWPDSKLNVKTFSDLRIDPDQYLTIMSFSGSSFPMEIPPPLILTPPPAL